MANILTKIPKFRRCVLQNFPFIEQDFDALTDYQLLCKVVEYLNKVINSQNAVIEIAEELTAAFNELQSFVDNYFDNLDVQEEINNKLDQMVEDGILQEIITAYIQANVAWTFDTVADMQSATNLVNGSFAQTLGFNAAGDGGGALYKITDTGTVDNLNTFAVGNLYATAVNNGVKKISLDELPLVGGGVYTLGRVKVDSAVELPRQVNRNIIIVDTVFDINTPVLFTPYNQNSYFILPSFVGCTFNNATSDNSRVSVTSGSTDIIASKITGCNFYDVDFAYNAGYAQDFNFTNCYIQSHTCFIHTTRTAQVRFVNCSVESESKQLINCVTLAVSMSGTYEGNASSDFYFVEGERGTFNLNNAWIESCKLLHLVGGESLVNKASISINDSILNGYTDATPQIIIDHPEFVEFSTIGTKFGAYNQNSRVCNVTPEQFYSFKGSFVYNQAKSYVKEMGGSNTYDYQLASMFDVNGLENKRFIRQEVLLAANTPKELTFDTGTYLLIMGRGTYGSIAHVNTYIVSVSKNRTNANAIKMFSSTDSYLDNTTVVPTKAEDADTTFTLTLTSTNAYACEFEMIKLY